MCKGMAKVVFFGIVTVNIVRIEWHSKLYECSVQDLSQSITFFRNYLGESFGKEFNSNLSESF